MDGWSMPLPSGSSCSQPGSKCNALHSPGTRRCGREGDPVVWALDAIEDPSVLETLDSELGMEALNKAIDAMASGKAPSEDGISPEIIKCGTSALLQPLHELLCLCWSEGKVPQDKRDSKNVTLYKFKGDCSDCNQYGGIPLLTIEGKVFAGVVLSCLQVLASRVFPESQCGFRTERFTVDMIFSIRQLQEKCCEQQMPLYIEFIDLTKAFDLVSRSGLFKLLKKIGCPLRLLNIMASFHDGMQVTVRYNGAVLEAFKIMSGVKQGCVLAPTLFSIFFSLLLNVAFQHSEEGVYLHTRSDGKLFSLSRVKAKTNVQTVLLREMLFADDTTLIAHTEEGLQHLINGLTHASEKFGLTISIKKTNVMGQNIPAPPTISIKSEVLEVTDQFTYLGSTVSSNLSLDSEIDKRIAKAADVFV